MEISENGLHNLFGKSFRQFVEYHPISAKDLPFGYAKGAVAVPHGRSFLLVGGSRESDFSHVIWYSGARDAWQVSQRPRRLGSPRVGVTAMIVSGDEVPPCKNVTNSN